MRVEFLIKLLYSPRAHKIDDRINLSVNRSVNEISITSRAANAEEAFLVGDNTRVALKRRVKKYPPLLFSCKSRALENLLTPLSLHHIRRYFCCAPRVDATREEIAFVGARATVFVNSDLCFIFLFLTDRRSLSLRIRKIARGHLACPLFRDSPPSTRVGVRSAAYTRVRPTFLKSISFEELVREKFSLRAHTVDSLSLARRPRSFDFSSAAVDGPGV